MECRRIVVGKSRSVHPTARCSDSISDAREEADEWPQTGGE